MLTLRQTAVVDKWMRERVASIKQDVSKNFNATGATAESVVHQVLSDMAEIRGSGVLYYGEYGRGPTKAGSSGGKTLREIIREWIDVKGIVPRDGISNDSLAYLITRKIHREGIKVPNRYNKGGILSNSINSESIKELREAFALVTIEDAKSEILKNFRFVS